VYPNFASGLQNFTYEHTCCWGRICRSRLYHLVFLVAIIFTVSCALTYPVPTTQLHLHKTTTPLARPGHWGWQQWPLDNGSLIFVALLKLSLWPVSGRIVHRIAVEVWNQWVLLPVSCLWILQMRVWILSPFLGLAGQVDNYKKRLVGDELVTHVDVVQLDARSTSNALIHLLRIWVSKLNQHKSLSAKIGHALW